MINPIQKIVKFGKETVGFRVLTEEFRAIEDGVNDATKDKTDIGIKDATSRIKAKFQDEAIQEYFEKSN